VASAVPEAVTSHAVSIPTPQLEGMPDGLVTVDAADTAVTFVADATLYPLDAVYGASYVFIDRCYVLLDRPEASQIRVTLSSKDPATDSATLRALVGEFVNELLACAWRHDITKQNRAVIESVTMHAFSGAMGPPSLEELEAFDFTDEPFEDPLGIAQSWEEKFKKKAAAPEAEPEQADENEET
jgi:His-Xaa-Ser system protein HxsD